MTMSFMQRRVVVTGMGMVTPVGRDLETTWKSLQEARSGVGTSRLRRIGQTAASVTTTVRRTTMIQNKTMPFLPRAVRPWLSARPKAVRRHSSGR